MERTFQYQLDGLSFEIRVFEAADGTVQAELTVLDGAADFNALYWGDEVEGNSTFTGWNGRDNSLNMNGEGSQYDGEAVEWDGAEKLSNTGLGREGTDKSTYLTAGETQTFTLNGLTSIEDVDFLGVRATSTSTDGGSIKAVSRETPPDAPDEPEPPVDPEEPDDCPKCLLDVPGTIGDNQIENLVFYFDTVGDGEIDYTVRLDVPADIYTSGKFDSEQLADCFACVQGYVAFKDNSIDFDDALTGVSILSRDADGAAQTDYFAIDPDAGAAQPDPLLNEGGDVDNVVSDYWTYLLYYQENCETCEGPKDPDEPQDPKDPQDPEDPKDPADPEDPEDPEDPDDTTDLFPEWPQDISNVVFHFDLDGDGEIDYWVKIDDFDDDGLGNDLDDYFECMRAFIADQDDSIDPDTALVGVSIKGGTQETQFFAVDGDTNGPEADPDLAPADLLNTGPGIDTTLQFEDFLRYYEETCEDEEMMLA